MTVRAESIEHVRWPPERFYWAVVDAPLPSALLSTRAGRARQLGYAFEAHLPGLAIEELSAVFERLPAPDDRYVACGLPAGVVEEQIAAGATTLTPTSLPAFMDRGIDARRLNLLVGPHLPPAVRRARARLPLVVAAGLLLCSVVISLGLQRRVRQIEQRSADLRAELLAVYEHALGPGARNAVGTSFPPERRILAELRQLEATRADPGPVGADRDGARTLASLLAHWPADAAVATDALLVQPNAIIIQGRSDRMADAQSLADALATMPGWAIRQPETRSGRSGVEFTVNLSAAGTDGGET